MNLNQGICGAGTYSVLLTLTVSSNVTGRQLQELPLTTAQKHVRAHLTQPKVCACLLAQPLQKFPFCLQAAVKPHCCCVKLPKNAQHLPSGTSIRGLAQTPSSQPEPQVKLTNTPFYTTLWMGGLPASQESKNHSNSVACHCCNTRHI